MVHDQPACPLVPGMGALHHPTLGQDHKAVGVSVDGEQIPLVGMRPASDVLVGWMAYDLDLDTMALRDGLCALSGVGGIDKYFLNAGILLHCLGHHGMGAVAVLDAGGGHTHRQQQPQGIHQHMALASLDLLARVIAALATLWLWYFGGSTIGSFEYAYLSSGYFRTNNAGVITTSTVNNNVWRMLTYTRSGSMEYVYVDGGSVGSGSYASNISTTYKTIGAYRDGTGPLVCNMDDFVVENVYWDSSTVLSVYNTTKFKFGL